MPGYFRRIIHCCKVFAEMMHAAFQTTYGAWRVSILPRPIVTIFGGSRWKSDNPYSKQAFDLAQLLVSNDISVMHGGGAGIMEAVTRGALEHKGKGLTLGVGVHGISNKNAYLKDYFELKYLFARKWLLTRYSVGFIFFPGGYGTFDELAEVLTLIQTNQLTKVPIILVGRSYWKPFTDWMNEGAVAQGIITEQERDLVEVYDDINEILNRVCTRCTLTYQEPVKKV